MMSDIHSDFRTAVRNNQPNMALHYLQAILRDMQDQIDELRDSLAAEKKKTAVKKKTTRKTTVLSESTDE